MFDRDVIMTTASAGRPRRGDGMVSRRTDERLNSKLLLSHTLEDPREIQVLSARSRASKKWQAIPDHPVHDQHRAFTDEYARAIDQAKTAHSLGNPVSIYYRLDRDL